MAEKGKNLLARRVREHRAARGWSQYDLEEYSQIHRNYIVQIEGAKKNVGVEMIQKLADGFNISIVELFTEPKLKRR